MQNGVGKTAIARVLAGLWAPESGTVSRPERGYNGVFVVPQRAYMVVGSLKDQYVSRTACQCARVALTLECSRIIYPHSEAQFRKSGKTLEDLKEILEQVHLAYLPAREGGWDTRKEWKDVLSGGEKQRVRRAWSLTEWMVADSFDRWVSPVCSITDQSLPYWMVRCFPQPDISVLIRSHRMHQCRID